MKSVCFESFLFISDDDLIIFAKVQFFVGEKLEIGMGFGLF